MRKFLCSASALALLAAAHGARAQDATSSAPSPQASGTTGGQNEVGEIIVTGTRQTGLRAEDSAQPIQVVGSQALTHVGQQDITQVLQQNVPSFNVQQYGSDAAALTVQAALRGLSPNDTLVLVNGKRRHATANLSVDSGTPYSGAATVDLSYIPTGAIDHVEVLTDGAAAQYGSDAIAGVVNIILKTADHGGTLSATGGQYYQGDGDTYSWYANKGISLGDKGFLNVTVEDRYHGHSQQGGADRRISNPDGSALSSLGAIDSGALNSADYPRVNRIYGDTAYQLYDGFYNAGYNLTDHVQLYSFGSYGQRVASAYENYRVPSKVTGTDANGDLLVPFPTGFSPQEKFDEEDYSFTFGAKGDVYGWNWDLASSYGRDRDQVATINSANAQLYPALEAVLTTPTAPQTNFHDGQFQFSEWTSSLDVDRAFPVNFLASPLNVALGAEYRNDIFRIDAGEPSSYYGGGAQSFDGYTPLDQGGHERNNYAFYFDVAADVIPHLHLDIAGRYENYSDFGDDKVGKFTARYDFTPQIALRGTVSTGFRAPTLQEEFYSGTNVTPDSADVQLPADSPAATLAGFPPLKPEQSSNYSAGVVLKPLPRLQITADAYFIDLRDRILGSGFIFGYESGFGADGVVSQGVLDAITAKGVTLDSGLSYAGLSIFTNAANTKTSGFEATATYASDFGDWGHVDWSIGFNYNNTTISRLTPLPDVVTNTAFGQTAILTPTALSALLTGAPKEKAILGATWTWHALSVNLREEVYGAAHELISFDGSGAGAGATNLQVGATGITDLDIGYKITPNLRLNIGANNLFDQRPANVPTVPDGSGGYRPADGNNVFGEPAQFSPYGINGGYYYGRLTFNF